MRKIAMEPSAMLNPVPVALVSCGDGTVQNLITAAWTGTVNSDPPMVYVSVRKSRYSHDLIEESGVFAVNLVTEAMTAAVDFCGVRSGREVDKFAVTGLTPVPAEQIPCPLVAESPVNLECRVREVHAYPTHDMFVGEIVRVHVAADLFDPAGRIALEQAGLVAYSHGQYFGLQREPLGFFGYSVMKPKTRKRRQKTQAAQAAGRRAEKQNAPKGRRTARSGTGARRSAQHRSRDTEKRG